MGEERESFLESSRTMGMFGSSVFSSHLFIFIPRMISYFQLRTATLCFLFVLSASLAYGQKNAPPSGQFGLGVYAITSNLPSGVEGTYAINENMQAGAQTSLAVVSAGGASSTLFLLSPFFRYQFPSTVSPFVQGGMQILSGGGGSNFGIFLGGGVAYYINQTIGVNAGIDLLNIFFSPSVTTFGWSVVRVGADWFF